MSVLGLLKAALTKSTPVGGDAARRSDGDPLVAQADPAVKTNAERVPRAGARQAGTIAAAALLWCHRSWKLVSATNQPWREAADAQELAQVLQGQVRGRRRRASPDVMLMHMGDFLMAVNPVNDRIMTSVYQALSAALAVRALYVARAITGLGSERMPAFLNHPLVTPKSTSAPHTRSSVLAGRLLPHSSCSSRTLVLSCQVKLP